MGSEDISVLFVGVCVCGDLSLGFLCPRGRFIYCLFFVVPYFFCDG